jgi:hypothetical protein
MQTVRSATLDPERLEAALKELSGDAGRRAQAGHETP